MNDRKKGRTLGYAVLVATAIFLGQPPAMAQRAGENAVVQAEDAFGTSVGNEQIGLYSSSNVRGFSPTMAGNVRIGGLYFDQVTQLNARAQASSQVRVGIAAQGYAFPAPTGVVDYVLRTPGRSAGLSALVESNTRGTTTTEFDGSLPLADYKLSLGGGAGFYRDVLADGSDDYELNVGVLADWNPSPGIQIEPFWSRTDIYDAHVGQVYVPDGPFLPPVNPGRHFFGPDWAKNREFDSNFGILAHADVSENWILRAGLFRSTQKKPTNLFLEIGNLTRQGVGELNVFSDPPSSAGSTSGELRSEYSFADGPRVHRLTLSLRYRDRNAVYGGSDFLDLGAAQIGQRLKTPKPVFQYLAQTTDHVDETTVSLSYQLAWKDLGVVGVGVQRPRYHKRTLILGQPAAVSDDSPTLIDLAVLGNVTPDISVYGDYTQGLEDSGIAPQNAANRNQALPAIVTRQKDVGVRWSVVPDVQLVAGLFDIQKPYFNLDSARFFTRLGDTENQGIEISMNGNIAAGLDLVAGAVLARPRVNGSAVRLGSVGNRPVGMPSRQANLYINWHPDPANNLSFDVGVNYRGAVPSTLDDNVHLPELATVNVDGRYGFILGGNSASLKVGISNLFDTRSWDLTDANAYNIYWDSGRRLDVRLIIDF